MPRCASFSLALPAALLLSACGTTDCPEGSSLNADGICELDDTSEVGDTAVDAGDSGVDGTDGGSDDGTTAAQYLGEVTATLTDVETVVRVNWTTTAEVDTWITFTDSNGDVIDTPVSTGTEHEVLLLGNTADTEVSFVVQLDDGVSPGASDAYSITTGSLPSGLPLLSVTGDYTPEWKYQVLPLQGTAYSTVIIDQEGVVVWYDSLAAEGNLMRAVISHDRQSLITCRAGSQESLETGKVVWAALDGSGEETVAFPYIDHDMVELPDGTIAGIKVDQRNEEGEPPKSADSIVEMDADGNFVEIWNAWDALDPEGYGLENESNWTHGNGLDYLPEEDAYLLAMKSPGTVAKIDRATGETKWLINGKMNQFDFPEGTEMVELQHQLEWIGDNNLIVFDNGTVDRGYSRAVEFTLDEDALFAEEVWSYIRDPSVFVYAKGDVHRFDDGTTQVVWSSSGEMQLVDEGGAVVWQANADLGQAITFVQPFQSFYDAE